MFITKESQSTRYQAQWQVDTCIFFSLTVRVGLGRAAGKRVSR